MFAFAYSFLFHLFSQAFSPTVVAGSSGSFPESLSFEPKAIYFSFVTLTSTGYGDIVPVHPAVAVYPVWKQSSDNSFPQRCWHVWLH